MADSKKKTSKPKRDEKGVLAALPSTRPERIPTRKAAPKPTPAAAATNATPSAAAPRKAAAAPRKAPAKPTPAQRATATRRKAAAPRTFEPTSAAEAAAGAGDERAAQTSAPRPRAVREGAPGIGTTEVREQPPSGSGRPSGSQIVTGAVHAASEVAQLGLKIGGQLLKRAVRRLPKP